jgi:hypothetical protein
MSSRGPAGHAPGPPDWLAQSSLPILDITPRPFARIHRSVHPPIFFSPGDSQPPVGRFDSATAAFGVLYMAFSLAGAFAETILRNPARRLVGSGEIATRSLSYLTPSRRLRLVRMHGPGLQALGVDNAVTTGPYDPCGRLSDALFAHPDRPDGIAYASRHDPDQLCVALFSRADITMIPTDDPVPLTDRLVELAAILRRHGKGLDS